MTLPPQSKVVEVELRVDHTLNSVIAEAEHRGTFLLSRVAEAKLHPPLASH